jgi:DNA-binding SARP family transcriptional activator
MREHAVRIGASRAPALRVLALGPLRIFRDSKEIGTSAWLRRQSHSLFAYLICARPRRVHKEELIEVLWKNADPGRGLHSLQVALSDLRAALANGGSRRDGRAFVCRLGEHYTLDVGPTGWVDAEAFEAECEAGRQADIAGDAEGALCHLEAADRLYAGDFLAEERFADWAAARRERLSEQYLDALQRLMRLHESAGRVEMAASTAKKLLSADPFNEACYRTLMRYLGVLGSPGSVVRAYLRCQKAMREGFDSEVAPETRKLAEALIGSSVDLIAQRHGQVQRHSLYGHIARAAGRGRI